MQELAKALEDLRALHQKVLGRPAPDLGRHSHLPFPVGVDPIQYALHEARELKAYAQNLASAPRPAAWMPIADSFLTEKELIVLLDIPGVPKESMKVLVQGDECIVRGTREPVETEEKARPVSVERPWGPFERRFTVPPGYRLGDTKAVSRDGVLELRIPLEKVEAPEERELQVS